jgi:hypothetical protein
MNKFIRIISALGIAVAATLVAAPAQAETFTWSSRPLTNLDPAGTRITGGITNFPTKSGLYLSQCLAPEVSGTKPVNCEQLVWVTPSKTPGTTLPTEPISFVLKRNIVGTLGAVDCAIAKCGLFFQFDHLALNDRSEDLFLPITFAAGGEPAPTLKADVISVTLNGAALTPNVAVNLGYRAKAEIKATSESGLPVVLASSTSECSYADGMLTALKGAGVCRVTATTSGNSTYRAMSPGFPFILVPGNQKLSLTTFGIKKNTTRTLPATTDFGTPIAYKSNSKQCKVESNILTVGKGKGCVLTATAAGKDQMWLPLNTTVRVNIK